MKLFKRTPPHKPGDRALVRCGYDWEPCLFVGHNGRVNVFVMERRPDQYLDDQYWKAVWL